MGYKMDNQQIELFAEWFLVIREIEQAQVDYNEAVEKAKKLLDVKMALANERIQEFIEREREMLDNEHQERALAEE